ncbi:antibiotic biosynthesis monooxygenase [Bartonella sp. HY329]|uniref:antibiotic biosynthesis monooxygenase family protein n=1 Tax=unclassified Bartonella TaxID=2645622 RepID=UPI0021C6B5A8|nr:MULTISPECIES: antibiotic biosynthesis monooxygenase [unclassified Bartonella]UXM95745.1 antibiotic biosynthesis monooxygenase [Bartonella sp. HY329]UXN10070.1 antibiotic biosynthesis monooxygenase [Bartonella sp. HY328]
MFAKTPPPYYLVAFSSQRSLGDDEYHQIAEKMVELALQQTGCLGAESVRDENGFGITNSFWRDEASIKSWKNNIDHQIAQKLGKSKFYSDYFVRVAKVERDYCFAACKMLSNPQ